MASASTTSTPPLKVLAVGPAVGSIRDLFTKVKAIDAKHGKFELLLVVGDFFGPLNEDGSISKETQELLDGDIEAPVPCYIMQGETPVPQAVVEKFAASGSEIGKNVFLLSKSGLLTTSHGLRIACLGGVYNEEVYMSATAPLGFTDPYFSSQTIEKLSTNVSSSSSTSNSNPKSVSLAALVQDGSSTSSHLIDVFISNVWPASIVNSCSTAPDYSNASYLLVPPLDDIVRQAKPRYHFSVGVGSPPQFWERDPFVWDEEGGRITRFISLGAFGGEQGTAKKARWFYAFSIPNPTNQPPAQPPKPSNATPNPFTTRVSSNGPRKRPFETSDSQNFIFGDVHQSNKRVRHERTFGGGGGGGKPPEGYRCKRCDSTEHYISDCPERSKPPEGYVCRVCNVPGHLLRDCPEKNAVGDTGGRRPPPGYVCRACASEGHLIQDCPVATQSRNAPRIKQRGQLKEIGPGECWFCLSNPKVAKHLIVSIGSECYLTLPKGQIIPTGEYARDDVTRIPGGGHVLIVPINHHPTLNAIPTDVAIPIIEEMEKYKSALRSFFAKHGCLAVMFEVGILSGKGGHAHVQVVPIPRSLLSKGRNAVEDAFIEEGKRSGVTFEEDPDEALRSCAGGRGNYFRVDLPDGGKLVHLIKHEVPFSIQFGREVLCNLLKMPERLDWKLCAQSDAEETSDAQQFKTAFAPFDTTQG